MRSPLKKKKILLPDKKYSSMKVTKLINYIMKDGKKDTARKIVYDAMEKIKKDKKGSNELAVLEEALLNAGPQVEVRSRRVGGANYQVPREVSSNRRLELALRWIIQASKEKKGVPMHRALASEIIEASEKKGTAFTKRENTHKMAEANKAFAHLAW